MSGSDNEHQGEIKCENPQADTKYIVFKQKLFNFFKYCPECGTAVIKRNQSTQGSQHQRTGREGWRGAAARPVGKKLVLFGQN